MAAPMLIGTSDSYVVRSCDIPKPTCDSVTEVMRRRGNAATSDHGRIMPGLISCLERILRNLRDYFACLFDLNSAYVKMGH
jgi:hypothetical protein